MFLRYAEYFLIALILIVFGTQVFWPMWRGTPVFPIFKSQRRRLEAELRAAREAAEIERLEQELRQEKERHRGPGRKEGDERDEPHV